MATPRTWGWRDGVREGAPPQKATHGAWGLLGQPVVALLSEGPRWGESQSDRPWCGFWEGPEDKHPISQISPRGEEDWAGGAPSEP